VGFTAAHAALFDEATVRAKLRRWIPEPLDLAVAVHTHDGHQFAVLYIGPNPKGCCIFAADGQHGAGKQQVTVFRKGDIFVRHGSASERIQHHDMDFSSSTPEAGTRCANGGDSPVRDVVRS
jgi:hypothetical protein